MRTCFLLSTVVSCAVTAASAQTRRPHSEREGAVAAAVATITAHDVLARIAIMADDSMRGRDTPSPGLDRAAEYVAREFRRLGLRPGGDGGTFIQRFPVIRWAVSETRSSVTPAGGPPWRAGRDFLVRGGWLSAPTTGVPFVLDGTTGSLDALNLSAIPPRGIVFAVADPGRTFGQVTNVLRPRDPAAIVLIRAHSDSSWEQQRRVRGAPRWVAGEPQDGRLVVLETRDATVREMLRRCGYDLDAARAQRNRSFTLTRLRCAAVTVALADDTLLVSSAPNVVGILEGSERRLKDEYVVVSAHLDHVGTADGGRCPAVGDDTICNGADDNASGTSVVIELAEAFARLEPKPRRSLIFVAVSGEERRLWGSEHFTAHPPVPISQLVADLNADMVGRNWKDTIPVIGQDRSSLGAALHRVADAHPELRMAPIDDPWPEENFYYRSDHYNFIKRGVPALFFFNGPHADYHRASDQVDKIDAEKAARIAALMFYLGLEIANAQERPAMVQVVP